ncbi:MAG: protease inhibitor I42 family protein [Bacilli bacterium]|nr:protease inhibitor I42 family protein [Bacilli bacterium]
MSKKIIIGIVVFIIVALLILVLIGIKFIGNESSKQLEITKEINAGIPFKWEYVIEDSSIVECSKVYVLKDENINGKVGASIYRNYVFKGLKEGVTHVTFKFVSITNEDYPPKEDVYTIKVDKDLNISLVVVEDNK